MAKRRQLKLIPTCVGTHEPGLADCDGDPSGAAHESRPCSWRIRCRGFQAHLAAAAEDAERYIQVVKLLSASRNAGNISQNKLIICLLAKILNSNNNMS